MSFGLIKSKGKLPAPYLEVERHPCPFYGFNGMFRFGDMMDSEGNQCALITDSYSPCQMEMDGDEPNWNLCPIKQATPKKYLRRFEESAKRKRAFPREFNPPEQSSWKGIPLSDWMDYVLDRK